MKSISTNPSTTVEIQRDAGDENDPITIQTLFNKIAINYGNRVALMQKDKTNNEWKGITYKVYREKVLKMAKVFIKLGLEKHGTVAILADNCVEWYIAEMAAIFAG